MKEAHPTVAQSPVPGADASSWPAVMAFFRLVVGVGAGAALALALTMFVIVPALGAGNVDRLAALGKHIDAGAHPDVVFLGSSVVVESVDAEAVAAQFAGPVAVENWAINGSGLREVRLIVPKVLAARPRYVVLNMLPEDLATPTDINIEKAYGYGMGRFADAWPPGDPKTLYPGISGRTIEAMRSSRFKQALYLRSTPLDWLNQQVRQALRHGLRLVRSDEWTRPYELTAGITGSQLEKHLTEAEGITKLLGTPQEGGIDSVRAMVQAIVDGGAKAVICIAPRHPALRERMPDALDPAKALARELGASPGVLVFDASELLGADDFADALHPNAAGREKFSRAIGAWLAETDRTGGGA